MPRSLPSLKTKQNTRSIRTKPLLLPSLHPSISFVLFSLKCLQVQYVLTISSHLPFTQLTIFWFCHFNNFQTGKSHDYFSVLILLGLSVACDAADCSPYNFYLLSSTTTLSWFFLYCHWPALVLNPLWVSLLSLNVHILDGSSLAYWSSYLAVWAMSNLLCPSRVSITTSLPMSPKRRYPNPLTWASNCPLNPFTWEDHK